MTVVCAALNLIHVSQCVLNLEKKTWTVHVTEPMRFTDGYRTAKDWDDFLQVLGYMIGNPVGNTYAD